MGKHLAPPPEHRGSVSTVLRRVVFGVLAGVLAACVAIAGVLTAASILEKRNPASVVGDLFVPTPQALFGKDRIAVLLVGLDYDYSAKDEEYSKNARTDTIHVASLNFPTSSVPKASAADLAVPRDMLVTYPNGRHDKINGAYSLGGIKKSEATIADFLGLPGFDRYVILRIDSTKALIDAIGGIDVVPDETMNYDDSWGHLHIHFTAGKPVHMNGEQAVSYSRFRHDACGDPCRIKRQQQVIRVMIAKLKHDRFNDLVHVRDLVNVLHDKVETNFTTQELVSVANAFSQVELSDVAMSQVPYTSDEDLACCGNVLIADTDARAALVRKLFLTPLSPAVPVKRAAVASIAPASITVDVRNGSGVPGLATKMAAALKKQGFTVAAVGNADAFSYDTTQIRVNSAAKPLAGERVRGALAITTASITPAPASKRSDSDVTVIVGRDFGVSQAQASAVK